MLSLRNGGFVSAALMVLGVAPVGVVAQGFAVAADGTLRYAVAEGELTLFLDGVALDERGWRFIAHGQIDEALDTGRTAFAIVPGSTLQLAAGADAPNRIASAELRTRGALLMEGGDFCTAIGDLMVTIDSQGRYSIRSTLTDPARPQPVFDLLEVQFDIDPRAGVLRLAADLRVAASWVDHLGAPDMSDKLAGTVLIEADLVAFDDAAPLPIAPGGAAADANSQAAALIGPDVVVSDLQRVIRYTREGDITAYAVGTTACNLGDEPASWLTGGNAHPVIAMSLYRLKDDRFDQIGLSWVKHGFFAVSEFFCSNDCDPQSTNGTELGVMCSDPYSAELNGVRGNMTPRYQVNAYTGYHPFGWDDPGFSSEIERRLQVHDADLDPAQNVGAKYFIQGHYVLEDDAAAGNDENNASYRRIDVINPGGQIYEVTVNAAWSTQMSQPAVRAWQDEDPTVVETDIRVPAEGLLILAAKTTDLGTGYWRYTYALQNLNSHRSVRSFSVPIAPGVEVVDPIFHDVDYHSGEPFDLTDWPVTVATHLLSWATQPHSVNPNANALRFGTVYTFQFDTNTPPEPTTITLEFFRQEAGEPTEVTASTTGPSLIVEDCNGNTISDDVDILNGTSADCDANGVPDECQLDCNANGEPDTCDIVGGVSDDCNGNTVPDECETDCNENLVPDDCDIAGGTSLDCNLNTVPDDCEPDCDGDGIPTACDDSEDTDLDGIDDCLDACPETTPPGACVCDEKVCCIVSFNDCIAIILPEICINSFGGTPACIAELQCRNGCLFGDASGDGVVDLADFQFEQTCFSGADDQPGYVPPSTECQASLDIDGDGDIDWADFELFHARFENP